MPIGDVRPRSFVPPFGQSSAAAQGNTTKKAQPQTIFASCYKYLRSTTVYKRLKAEVEEKTAILNQILSCKWLYILPLLTVGTFYFAKWNSAGNEAITEEDLGYIVRHLREEIRGIGNNPANMANLLDQKITFPPSRQDTEATRKLEYMVHELRMEMKQALTNMTDCEAESHYTISQVVLAVIVFVLLALCSQHVLSEKERKIRLEERLRREKKMKAMEAQHSEKICEIGRQQNELISRIKDQFLNDLTRLRSQMTIERLQDEAYAQNLFREMGHNCQQFIQAQLNANDKKAIEWQQREETLRRNAEEERKAEESKGGCCIQ